MLKGKSFSIDTGKLDAVLSHVRESGKRADKLIERKMNKAVDIVWRVAHQKRPMISKSQAKTEGRTRRVSNPDASAGVPVRTGVLQASIQKSVKVVGGKWIGRIWTDTPYAKYMEFGTSKIRARAFMRPAINLTRDALKLIFGKKENA